MKRQTQDLVSIVFGVFFFFLLLEMLVTVPLYGLAFLVGNGYPLSEFVTFNIAGVFIGEFLIFFPLFLLHTRYLKDDPFRFSPTLRAFFRLPEGVDAENLLKLLRRDFIECRVESPAQLKASWVRLVPEDGLQTYQARSLRKIQRRPRPITIDLLSRWQGFKEQRVEVSIETGTRIKLINSEGMNQVALQVLIEALGWEKYRVPVDVEGRPKW